jgi:hypothetical protein
VSSQELPEQLAREIERIQGLPLEQQPAEYEQLRLQQDQMLNQAEGALNVQLGKQGQ